MFSFSTVPRLAKKSVTPAIEQTSGDCFVGRKDFGGCSRMELCLHSRSLIIKKKDKFTYHFILCKDTSAGSKTITDFSNTGASLNSIRFVAVFFLCKQRG